MDKNIWNKDKYKFLTNKCNEFTFNNTTIASRRFDVSEKEVVIMFTDMNRLDFVEASNTEYQIIRYCVEIKDDGEEDDVIVHRIVSKIILN